MIFLDNSGSGSHSSPPRAPGEGRPTARKKEPDGFFSGNHTIGSGRRYGDRNWIHELLDDSAIASFGRRGFFLRLRLGNRVRGTSEQLDEVDDFRRGRQD